MSDAKIDFRSNPRLIPDDARLKFGTGNDTELVWSTADADNHSLVLALGDSNQALHVTDVGAVATDWNVAADTHPALYIHSNTTPATDYLKIGGHDGTNATIDLVGGTTLKIAFDGSADIDISATALSPSSDGGNALGTTSLGWNGLHLNTGTAINWENGDVTLTHAAGKLTLGGDGAVEFDFAGHEMTNVDIDSGAIDGVVIGASSVAAGSFAAVVGTTGTLSGVLKTDDTTEATTTATGALQTAGGASITKDLVLGGQVHQSEDANPSELLVSTAIFSQTNAHLTDNAAVEAFRINCQNSDGWYMCTVEVLATVIDTPAVDWSVRSGIYSFNVGRRSSAQVQGTVTEVVLNGVAGDDATDISISGITVSLAAGGDF
ncbi:MAG: hypothetical protein IIB28_06935, partial [Chloroflexi bacterium]|nr:hypothetical protein [Chloroflexota bacterium]